MWFDIQGSRCYWKGNTLQLYDIIIIFVATVVVIMINIIMIVTKQIAVVHSFYMEFFKLNLFVTLSIHEVLVVGWKILPFVHNA